MSKLINNQEFKITAQEKNNLSNLIWSLKGRKIKC